MTTRYYSFKENKAEIKNINMNNFETLYEKPWLKFRDIEHVSVQESPCSELMALAREGGIRPQTTANGIKNMFFIHEQYLEDFILFLEKEHADFAKFIIQKIQSDKENNFNIKCVNEPPQWF